MKVLVLGAAGQVGRLLLPAFAGHDVRAAGRADADLRDAAALDRLVKETGPDAVVCAAGIASPDVCEDRPSEAYAVNVDGARRAAEASRGLHFTLFSTDYVFDGRDGPYGEGDRPNPISVYGRTKVEAERVVRAVSPDCLVIRTALVYAAGDRSFFGKVRDAREPVPCWTDQWGTPTWGPSLAAATAELVAQRASGLWNLAGPDFIDRHAFALKVAARFGVDPSLLRPVSIREAPPRGPRPLKAGLRIDRARASLRTKLLSIDEALEIASRTHVRP